MTGSKTRTRVLVVVVVYRQEARSYPHPWFQQVVGLVIESWTSQRRKKASCVAVGRCPLSLQHRQARTRELVGLWRLPRSLVVWLHLLS